MMRVLFTIRSTLFVLSGGLWLLSGCGIPVGQESAPSNDGLNALTWSSTSPSQLDAGTGLAFTPRIAVEPDPADGDGVGTVDDSAASAMAVWVEKRDLNFFDNKPAIYHLYARRWDGSTWQAAVQLDTGVAATDDFGAWVPRVAMDTLGNAFVVWQQGKCVTDINSDGDCNDFIAGDVYRSNIYARRYLAGSGGGWQAAQEIDDAAGTDADLPDIAMEPDGGGTAMAVWTQHVVSGATWSTSHNGANNTIRGMAVFNGRLYAAETSGTDAAPTGGNILVYDDRTAVWAASPGTPPSLANGNYEEANALFTYCSPHKTTNQDNCRLYAAMGGLTSGTDGDIWMFDGTTWVKVFDGPGLRFTSFSELNGYLYAGNGGAAAGGFGDVYLCIPVTAADTTLCDLGDWAVSYNGTGDQVSSLASYHSRLYAGLGAAGAAAGSGDIIYCQPWADANGVDNDFTDQYCDVDADGAEWSAAYSPASAGDPYEAVFALVVFNGILYAGTGSGADDGDILRCTPSVADPNVGACNATANWTTSYDPGVAIESVRSLGVHVGANLLFAGLGDSAGEGDIYQCSPTTDVSVTYPTGGVSSTITYKACGSSDWTKSENFEPGAGYENIRSLKEFNGFMFAGAGQDATDGDVFVRKAYDDYQVMARRFTGGVWATTDADSGCPVVHRANDGICDLDAAVEDSSLARIAMDNSARATAAFVRMKSSDCSRSLWLNNTDAVPSNQDTNVDTTLLYIPCFDDRLYVDRFDGPNWLGAFDITPIESLGTESIPIDTANPNTNCEDTGELFTNDGEEEALNLASPCVDIGSFDLAMDTAGNTAVAIQTFEWVVTTDTPGGIGTNHSAYDLSSNQDIRIYAKGFGQGQSWVAESWSQNSLSAYEWTTDAGTLTTSTCNSITDIDPGTAAYPTTQLQIMNCNLMAPVVAIEPDPADNDGAGVSATSPDDALSSVFVTYERYNGTRWDIGVHRCVDTNGNGNCGDAGEWGTVADPDLCTNLLTSTLVGNCWGDNTRQFDAGANNARSPRIATDNYGNAHLTWTQRATSDNRWRIYTRYFCQKTAASTGACATSAGWQGVEPANITIDTNVAGEEYFNPVLAVEATNAGNSAANCGQAIGCGNAYSVFEAIVTSTKFFRIDASRWTPP